MNERLRKILEERARLTRSMRELLDKAEAEKRDLSAEETQEYEKMEARMTALEKSKEREEKLEAAERAALGTSLDPPEPEIQGRSQPENRQQRIQRSVRRWLAEEMSIRSIADVIETRMRGENLPADFVEMQNDIFRRAFLREGVTAEEMRALQMDADIYGGYTVMPMQMIQDIIMAMDNLVFIRGLATRYQVPNAASLGVPSLDADPADPTWTSEILTGSADSTMSFGKRELQPHPLAQRILVSRKLLRSSFVNMEQVVRQRLAYKSAVVQENAFLNGTGSNQPLGVMVASNDGISTSYDVSTGNETDSPTFDGLIEAKYTLKSQYWPRARWCFHQDCVKLIRKLKDGNGQYIWQPSVVLGQPDRILDLPYFMSQYQLNTFTTGQYVGILGDWSYYWIVDALNFEVQRLEELYAATNQVGLISRAELDGMPVLGEAFVRVKLG